VDLSVVTPEGILITEQIEELTVPGEIGQTGILKHHLPLVTRLTTGEMRYRREDGGMEYVFLEGGVLKLEGDEVFILTHSVKRAAELREEGVAERIREMNQKIREAGTGKTKPDELDRLLKEIRIWKIKRAILEKAG